MHYLITGGCGFIGSHLAQALVLEGHSVRILDNLSSGRREAAPAAAEIVVGDVADAATVREATQGVDGIFHLAAIASVEQCRMEWPSSHRTNLGGTVAVLDAAARSGREIPVVYASSAAVYGNQEHLPLSEDTPALPLTSYGQDKLSGEQYARIAHLAYGVPSVGLRFFNVYGAGQDPSSPYSGVISRFMQAAAEGAPVTLYGDGEQSRDFVYVGDVVSLLTLAMQQAPGKQLVVNGATGQRTSLLKLLETIESLTGRPLERLFASARAGDIRHSLGDPHKAKKILGFSAHTPLENGLATLLPTAAQEAACA